MLRNAFLLLGLIIVAASASGCQSCASCHDYDPPVANCDCNAGGVHRAGSVHSGYVGMYSPPAGVQEQATEPQQNDGQQTAPPQQSRFTGPQFWN